ncbi:uroporphyrinogen decarboxylase [Anaerocolumna cellulosilytica]|uniref:Uroporphyrinogen decarboxylase n=1 Tax=Anaerocolumna cellulosilytica TaxID=433286 RepID=A0A6S6QUB3_9FIRM|nr:mandelate racemase/muconate lactonizing enzyme family protein [Anaerocolumna cellulosilytica]MBB5194323.1 L-alanine-DL-glutamate epimerase-like enolase superfamily enzyme [Anaerocolumna cellulosilytica]BCJ93266.1 uroporphyrinogen decarboxylase [Anaerocolumna cellulosilytica]
MNKIKDIKLYQAVSKVSQPIADATHEISQIKFYIVEVFTEEGVRGQGYLLSFHYSPKAIEGALADIKNFVLEREFCVHETVRLKEEYEKECEYFGNTGLLRWAQAAVNVAMWDAWGKILKQPIYKIFGSNGKKIPVYGSGGWLSYTDEELVHEVTGYKQRGFGAVKIKVGSSDMERDLERLRKVREAVGKDMKIMMDANQGLDVPRAIQLSLHAQSIGINWFEEPISNQDFKGYETIRSKTGISLAMGEREFDETALKSLIEKNALDLWQPDLLRLGGVEVWRKTAALAAAYQIPCLPHYYKDYDVPLLATIEKPYGAESFDWIDAIIDNPMKIVDGYAILREEPGWGITFKEEFLESIES